MPSHNLKRLEEDGRSRLHLEVSLPGAKAAFRFMRRTGQNVSKHQIVSLAGHSSAGVQSASEIEVVITERSISVRVPGRYRLELPLGLPVTGQPQSVKFVRKKALLRAILLVEDAPDAAQPSCSSPTADSSGQPTESNEPPTLHTANGGGGGARKRGGNTAPPRFLFSAPPAPGSAGSQRPHQPLPKQQPGAGPPAEPSWAVATPNVNGGTPHQAGDERGAAHGDLGKGAAAHRMPHGDAAAKEQEPAVGSAQRQHGIKRGFFGAPVAKGPASNGASTGSGLGGSEGEGLSSASTAMHQDAGADLDVEAPPTPSPAMPPAPQMSEDNIYEAAKVRFPAARHLYDTS